MNVNIMGGILCAIILLWWLYNLFFNIKWKIEIELEEE